MAITVEDIKSIRIGESRPFNIIHPKEVRSARSLCTYVALYFPELKTDYSLNYHRDKKIAVITARKQEGV